MFHLAVRFYIEGTHISVPVRARTLDMSHQ